jgi:hypothetical protein
MQLCKASNNFMLRTLINPGYSKLTTTNKNPFFGANVRDIAGSFVKYQLYFFSSSNTLQNILLSITRIRCNSWVIDPRGLRFWLAVGGKVAGTIKVKQQIQVKQIQLIHIRFGLGLTSEVQIQRKSNSWLFKSRCFNVII